MWKHPTDGKRIYYNYLIDTHGTIKTINEKTMKCRVKRGGYVECGLTIDHKQYFPLIHRLVMCTFRPVPNMINLQVNHINGKKTDNDIDNLEWVTCTENMIHARNLGLYNETFGEKSVHAKHTNQEIDAICRDIFVNKLRSGELMRKYNISKHLVDDLRRGKSWKVIVHQYTKGSTTT